MDDGDVPVTFNLIPTAASALEDIAMIEGVSETDALNRALEIYQNLLLHKQLGKQVALVEDTQKWGVVRVRKIEWFDWK